MKRENEMIKNMGNRCGWGEKRFNNLTPEQKNRQRGITMIEITAGLVIIALLAIFLVPRVGALLGKSKVESGVQEITGLVGAFEQYRLVKGNYTDMSFITLESGGFHIEPFGAENATNAYGQDIVLDPNGNNLTLTYTTGVQADCEQIATRIDKLSPVTIGTACDVAGVVIFNIGN